MKGRALALGLLAVIALPACGWLWGGAPRTTQEDALRTPHARHAAAKVDCVACHDAVWDSKELGDRVVPGEATCMSCHKERKRDCAMCHTAVSSRVAGASRAIPPVRMSHADHLPRVNDDCRACHQRLPDPFATVETKPTMSACLGCHEHRVEYDEGRCARCHRDLSRYGVAPLASFSHAGNFVREHARPARTAPEACATCHDQTFCTACHAGTVGLRVETKLPERVDRDFIHRNDFLSRHAIEARADGPSCARCHGTPFCAGCHEAQGLTSGGQNPRDPHPPGWAIPGSASFHGVEARRDIMSCAACHDQGARSTCVGCHKVGGIGGDPHPPGFSARHGRDEITRNGMCAACHAP